ncbi:MAG TPA: nuclear transport factor 2 family protein [Ramlibacter sp.]|nr:nuclear transport factor 2 family protein [Ramlibacter sp.]
MTTTHLDSLVDAHLGAYCEPDAARRQAAIARLWHPEGRLVDPPMAAAGHAGIDAQAAQLLQHFPGHRFARTTGVEAHHEFLRYGWALRDAAGADVLRGTDFVRLDVDGRLLNVVGFFEPAAA